MLQIVEIVNGQQRKKKNLKELYQKISEKIKLVED